MSHPPSALPAESPGWQRRFFVIWIGQALSLSGSQLVQFALIWYLTVRTGSASALAGAALAGLLPQVLLSPLIGTLVDRWSRRAILIVADAGVALATLVLAALFQAGVVEEWHVYVLLFARAVGSGFHQSAMGASLVLIVPRRHLSRVQGLNQALHGGLNIVAAPLGALLLERLPIQGILAIDITTALAAIVPLLFIALPRPQRTRGPRASVWGDLRAGLAYVLGWPALMAVLAMVMLINFLLQPTEALLPLLVRRHFAGGAIELGWVVAANGLGVVLGGAVLGVWGGFRRRVVTAQLGLVGLGAGVMLTGLAPPTWLWLAVAGALVSGLMQPIVNGSYGAALQASIAPEMQGRVFALILSIASAMSPLGLALAGPLSDLFGVQIWFLVGGAVCALMGVVGLLIPAVMALEPGGEHASGPGTASPS
jgi:DHA3 family macrolide efflux protein-like MFS transporter